MRRAALLAGLTFAAAACGPSISANSDFNPQFQGQMAGWTTYAWAPIPRNADTRIYNDITNGRVRSSVDRQLAARGMRIDEANPDFRIAWHADVDGQMDVTTINNAYGYGYRWYGPMNTDTYVDQYDEGTLILDFVDTGSNQLAWRGVASGRLSERRDGETLQREIDAAVEEILAMFPPGS